MELERRIGSVWFWKAVAFLRSRQGLFSPPLLLKKEKEEKKSTFPLTTNQTSLLVCEKRTFQVASDEQLQMSLQVSDRFQKQHTSKLSQNATRTLLNGDRILHTGQDNVFYHSKAHHIQLHSTHTFSVLQQMEHHQSEKTTNFTKHHLSEKVTNFTKRLWCFLPFLDTWSTSPMPAYHCGLKSLRCFLLFLETAWNTAQVMK